LLLAALAIVAPIFGLVALGYGAARARLVSSEAGNALSEYVFVLAIPALLFRIVATADVPALNPFPFWIAYFGALTICWALAGFLARRDGRDPREAAVIGFSAAQSNTVLVGIPMILGTIGEAGAIATILLLAVHLPLTMTAVTLLIARGESGAGAWKGLLRSLVTHPILVAIGAGLLWRQLGVPTPDLMRTLLKYLADSAAPCALVAMGMSMTRVSLAGNRRMIGLIAAIKLVLHPLLVYVLTVHVLSLPPPIAAAAILFAACPSGINAFLVAERYRVGASIASGAITLSTLLAVVTMTLAVTVTMALVK
jgi:malonate transporter